MPSHSAILAPAATRSIARSLAILAALALPARASAETLSDWPCKSCVTHVGAGSSAPRPLLVALHGDGGEVGKIVRAWKAACDDAGVILLAPRCPVDLDCPAGSWWQWRGRPGHDPGWLAAQIDATAGRFPVDRARVHAAGYSGGATYLGWYAPAQPTVFASIAHVAGGMPWGGPCPSCKYPVLFVIGNGDPMVVPYTRPLREYYDACGHELVWEGLPGVTHEGIVDVMRAGRAKSVLAWLLARPAACGSAPDAGAADASPDASAIDAATPEEAGAADPPRSPSLPKGPPRAPGCACDLAPGTAPAGLATGIALAAAGAIRRARKPRRRRAR